MKFNNILMILSLWDEQKGPTIHECNQEITKDVNAVSIQCFMPCFHLFSTSLAEQSKKPLMSFTLPLPNYEKFARIYFGCWEDQNVRGQFRAFGIFIILDYIGTMEELLFDSVIKRLKLSEDYFKRDLMRILEQSFISHSERAFDAEIALNSIKSRLITITHLTNVYKIQELKLMAKKLGLPTSRRSKKNLAGDILISLLGLEVN